MACNILDEI